MRCLISVTVADTVRARVRGTQPQALLAHLHDVLFDEEGFQGNTDDYYNVNNSYLPVVLQSKQGLPITLSLLYKAVAERLGLKVWGIGLPGHFICGLNADGSQMLIDPFSGGRLPGNSFYDVDGDGDFDETIGEPPIPVSGIGMPSGPNSPIFIGDIMQVSLDDATSESVETSGLGMEPERVSWRELLRN